MDARLPIAYMVIKMRLLLLLSAFFAAVFGGVAEIAPAAQPVEQSTRVVGGVGLRQAVHPPHPVTAGVVTFADARPSWHLADAAIGRVARPLYTDRRRE